MYLLINESIGIWVRFAGVLHADRSDDEVLLHETAQDHFRDVIQPERFQRRREELKRCQRQLRRDLVGRLFRVLHREVAEILQRLALFSASFRSIIH